MKTTNKNRKSKFLALLLSVMMFSSMGAAFASCADDTDSSSSSPSSSSSSSTTDSTASDRVDNGTIKNGHFDFTTLSETVKIGSSVTGWSRSVNSATTGSAPSSKSASGVIDTEATAWADLTTRNKTDEEIAAMEISDFVDALSANKDAFTTADKLAFYENWEDREENEDLDIEEEFEDYKEDSYKSFNIDTEDLPALGMASPGVAPEQPDTDEKGKDRDVDTKILMIHNNNSIGTAQKFASNSITIKAGSAAKFSIWVKTSDLKTVDSDKQEQDAVGKGAYINIAQTVGGKVLDSYEVKNIETNEWKKYTFYVKGSSFADTSLTISLGLGQSGGTDHLGYVNGYAFFDNITFEELSLTAYNTQTSGIGGEVTLTSEKADKTVDTYVDGTRYEFAMNFYGEDDGGWKNADDKFDKETEAETTKSSDGAKTNEELYAESSATDKMKLYEKRSDIASEAASNAYLNTVYNHFLKDTDEDNNFLSDEQAILMMLSSKGTAYTWENAYEFTMPANINYMAVSFFVKTSDFGEGTGVSVKLVDIDESNGKELNSTSFSSINTSDLAGVTIDGVEDYYDGWQRCYFFVEKDKEQVDTAQTFRLTLNYGPTDVTVSTAKTAFNSGFAAFTRFETLEIKTKLEYECAQTGDYAVKYTLVPTEEEEKAAGNGGFDSAAGTPTNALDKGLANLQNFKGVFSDSYYVTLPANGEPLDETKRYANTYENAGLLNRDSFVNAENDMVTANAGKAWMEGLKSVSGKTDATAIWNGVFGDATQPLFIWNDDAANKPYGYIGSSATISSTNTVVSVRVKTSANAVASVYLVDMDDETRQSYLGISGKLTYWYDDNGNILTGDPASKDTEIAFRLDKNTGLYKANKKWSKYETYKDVYFANLAAYAGYAEGAEVLYAAENSASHSYHDYMWDRAVYYKHTDGAYYTKANGEGIKVTDLQSVTDLAPRYEAQAKTDLKIENINTNGEWVTVTFYIKKGNAPKNYRLEVWSGTRAGVANPEGSYVIFDSNTPGTADTNYDSLMEEYKDTATTKFESVFSYYDTDKHVRYDKELDVDEVGNLYDESFKQSSYEAAIAYMLHEEKEGNLTVRYTVFADYSLSDASVVARQPDTDDDDTSDDTTTDTDEDDTNIFMLISSISVSAVLVLALILIAVRRFIKFWKKRKAMKASINAVKKNQNKNKTK